MTIQHADTTWRPIACVAVRDDALREMVTDALHDAGWAVIHQPTGLHVVETLSGLILGDQPWLRVELVVVEDHVPGCRGRTIERGLRDLGIDVSVVVLDDDRDAAVRALRSRCAGPRRRSSATRWAPPPPSSTASSSSST